MLDFLAFHDELIGRLYAGDPQSYFELGEQSAFWALTDGPYQGFIRSPDIAEVAKSFSRIWRAYYTETTSWAEGKVTDGGVEFSVFGLPDWHPYFEYHVVGYMKGALGLVCANPIEATRIRGSEQGYTYLLHLGSGEPAVASAPEARSSARGRREPGARSRLSPREAQVLALVAHGKTNKEIGAVLGISDRTVQIHISHIYHKLGVYNRAGATMWLSEHPRSCDGPV